jgi:hypothetical protein
MAYDNYDYSSIEEQLKQRAQQKGVTYDPSDLEGIKRNASYTDASGNFTGTDPTTGLQNAFATYDQRAAPKEQPQYQSPTQQWNAQSSAPAPQQNPQMSALYQLLMQRATQGPVTAKDPTVRAQVDPAAAQIDRTNRYAIDDIAEQAGPLANLTGERRLAAERGGQAKGQLEAQVIGRQQDQRAQDIQQALSLYGNLMSEQQRNELTRELAYLQDNRAAAGQQLQSRGLDLQSQGLSNSMDQFLRDLALRESNQNNLWDYNWATLGA